MHNGVAMQPFPNPAEPEQKRSPITPLGIVLGLVIAFFCAVLVFVYIATKRINPVMLDQHGAPLDSQSQPAQSSPPAAKAKQPAQPPAAR
ncbi:MAG: hypothetical protein ACLPY1_16080 [Terracidiphilus sp.]